MGLCKFIIIIILIVIGFFESVYADDWQLEGFQVKNKGGYIIINVDTIKTPFTPKKVSQLSYKCLTNGIIYPSHQCIDGEIEFLYDGIKYYFLVSGLLDISKNNWDLVLQNKEKSLLIHIDSKKEDKLNIELAHIAVEELIQMVKQFVQIDTDNLSAFITADFEIDLSSQQFVKGSYFIEELTWESIDGNYVVADNYFMGKLSLIQADEQLKIHINNTIKKGEGLFKDIYVLFDETPTKIVANIKLDKDFDIVTNQLLITSGEDVKVKLDILDMDKLSLIIKYEFKKLEKLYSGFLASYFEIIGINDLEVIGNLQGDLEITNGEVTKFSSIVNELSMVIESKKISVEHINASLNWQQIGDFQNSTIAWDSLLLAGMPIEKSTLSLNAVGQQLMLESNSKLPIFDGSLIIDTLVLKDIFQPEITIDFQGEVMPISLALITEKMGWPIMTGTIAGKIPGMKKVGESITFDGVLDINVFEGSIKISNLSIERLFGVAPVIAADLSFDKLNLKQITSTFDFGEITGLVKGYVKGLRVTNWKPDRLDASIQSIKSKKVKQTISQRAIDNISSIGGIQGALSRSFLRFFDHFKYKKIGIGCKLRNSICEMSGVKNSNNAYTLIEGKGIPSININGFRRFIDWEVFLDRLLEANY